MTIKNETAKGVPASTAPPSPNDEEEIVVSGHAIEATGDSARIPFATAVPIGNDVPPSYNPAYSGTTVQQPTSGYATTGTGDAPPSAPAANTYSSQSQYPTLAAAPGDVATGGSVAVTTAITAPPPGLPPGGQWVSLQGAGCNTWTVCTIVSVISCLFICLPCGLWAFLCPCDDRRAYLVNGKLFDESGGMIGSSHSRRYR